MPRTWQAVQCAAGGMKLFLLDGAPPGIVAAFPAHGDRGLSLDELVALRDALPCVIRDYPVRDDP
jgi:hypothetical protein